MLGTQESREQRYSEWRERYEKYRAAVLEKAKPESKQYTAALRTEEEIRALWFRRFKRPEAPL